MTQKTYQHIAAAALLLLLFAGSVQAQTVSAPRTISYQGELKQLGGAQTPCTRTFEISLYADQTGDSLIWRDILNAQVDSSGIFNLELGSDNPLPNAQTMDRPIWMGIGIDNGKEMRPLSLLSASPYALNVADQAISTNKVIDGAITSAKIAAGAVQSANLADSSITTAKLADGAVTWDKMGTDYVPYIRVNGDKVTTGHNSINFTGSEGMMVDYDSTTMSLIFHPDTALSLGNDGKGGYLPLSVTPFSDITTATNTVAVMTVGTGASIVLGGGTVQASAFIGSGSTTNAVDLNTAEVNGVLPVANGGTGSATVNAWNLSGNVVATNFIGSTNALPFVQKTNNITALQLVPTTATSPSPGIPNIIGGFGGTGGNAMSPTDIQGSIIAGGGGSGTEGLLPNTFATQDDASTISGGEGNVITFETADLGNQPEHNNGHVIAGGIGNTIISEIIGSEQTNVPAPGAGGTIGGGQGNLLCGPFWGTIAGGQNNLIATANPTVDDDFSAQLQMNFIGGGNSNTIGGLLGSPNAPNLFGSFSVIAGGQTNHIGGGTVIGGVPGPHGTTKRGIGAPGVVQNPADFSAIGGGQSNSITTDHGTIGGGQNNSISTDHGTIGGGSGNTVNSSDATIAGGISNTASGSAAAITGGYFNGASGGWSVIGGGTGNTSTNDVTTVGGGRSNNATGPRSIVAGGQQNNATGNASSIGGGWQNTVSNFNFGFGNIPGGVSLASNGDAETVLGWMNFYQPTLPINNSYNMWANGVPGNPARDARILEIGSPFFSNSVWTNYNAFEVSYNGHSIVYHTNGSSILTSPDYLGSNQVYQGGTYVESPVYAWGEYNPASSTPVVSDFGVSQIVTLSPGVFMVSLSPADPHDPTKIIDLSRASITVTVVNNDLSDITIAPPAPPVPPQPPMMPQSLSAGTLSGDSVRKMLGVPDSVPDPTYTPPAQNSSNSSQSLNEPESVCNPPAELCGYATASDFTVLNTKFPGAGLQYSFIIRTYQGGSTGCQAICLPFFFKVCHR